MSQVMQIPFLCPKCANPVHHEDIFCSHCGFALKEQSISFSRQLYIYSVSLLLPPFGLVWFFKYLRSSIPTNRKAGFVCGILTVVGTIFLIWTIVSIFQGLQQTIYQYQGVMSY